MTFWTGRAVRALALAALVITASACETADGDGDGDTEGGGTAGGSGPAAPSAFDGVPDGGAGDPQSGELFFGTSCQDGAECENRVCIQVAEDRSVCSAGCELDDETTCPPAENWACLVPNEIEFPICACQSDAPFEICADGLDNDCDGFTDNCRECAGLLIPPGDADHCGACGRRCLSGATCVQGECICEDGSTGEQCVREPGAPQCQDGGDCDDGIPCTEDVCMSGRCVNTVVPARCGETEVCDLRKGGCVDGTPCAVDSDCADDDPCTTGEFCDPATRVCLWSPLDGDADGQPPRVCGGTDCNDADGLTFTGAFELCDGIDNSCNGVVDGPIAPSACADGQSCVAGSCACDEGLTCGEQCFDGQTDPAHCGECYNACAPGAVCDGGQCVCPNSLTECSDGCFDLQEDDDHCGACNDSGCALGLTCDGGLCVDFDECEAGVDTCDRDTEDCVNMTAAYRCECKAGYRFVSGSCVDINECLSAANHDCFNNAACVNEPGGFSCECPAGYTGDGRSCENVDECDTIDCGEHGSCQDSVGSFTCNCDPGYGFDGVDGCTVTNACQAGLELPERDWCLGSCVTLATHPLHCGECANPCTGGTCTGGECICDVGEDFCEGSGCVDLDSTAAHCGACGDPCPTGASCIAGECFCPGNQVVCDGACVSLGSTANCSACGDSCAAGATCTDNACTCPGGAPDVCNDTCVDVLTDEAHCGDCGDACAAGATCTGGMCNCPGSEQVCDAQCVDSSTDEAHCGTCGTACDVVCSDSACATAVELYAGRQRTCARLSDGTLWCWGNDAYGLLGDDPVQSGFSTQPLRALNLDNVLKVSLGYQHSCAVEAPSSLYCWGDNPYQQVAQGTSSDRYVPTLVRSGVADVAAGRYHTCALLTDGTVECVGSDSYGVRGDGSGAYGNGTWSQVETLDDADAIVSGDYHVCALQGGVVYCWGYNYYGQLGQGTSGSATDLDSPAAVVGLSGVDAISAGANHTCAVVDGSVYCWGSNSYYQVGAASGSVQAFATEVSSVSGSTHVSAGSLHTCATATGGEVRCWGSRGAGRLGDGSTASGSTATPVVVTGGRELFAPAAGDAQTCALDAAGEVLCWGSGVYRENGANGNLYTPTELSTW